MFNKFLNLAHFVHWIAEQLQVFGFYFTELYQQSAPTRPQVSKALILPHPRHEDCPLTSGLTSSF
jgi:hypothetical protein